MQDNKDFDNWYKTKITENDQHPPEGAWQNIANELDVNDVWQRISVELDTPRGWSPAKAVYYALPALLLLFLGGAYYYFNKPTDTASSTLAFVEKAGGAVGKVESIEKVEEAELVEKALAAGEAGSAKEVQQVENPEKVEVTGNAGDVKRVTKTEKVREAEVMEKVGEIGNVGNVTGKVEEAGEVADEAGAGKVEEVVAGEVVEKMIEDTRAVAGKVGELQKVEEFEVDQKIEEVGVAGRGGDVQQWIDVKKGETVTAAGADNGAARPGLTSGAKTDALSVEAREESLAASFGENKLARNEELTTASEGTTRSQRRLPSAIEKHAGIHTVVMPDSMLNIYPVTVSLHPDSIEWIAVEEAPQERTYDKTFEFGLTGSAKNTWLLNRRTLAGLEKHTLNTTVPDFGKDMGLMFAWNFSPALSAQAEGMFLSEAGQRYKEYRNGKYVDREVDLRYYSLNVILKYRLNKLTADHQVNGSALIAGLYASRLNNATEIINGKNSDRRPAYHDRNYGVILGYEYNRCVLPNVILSSGLRMNYGIPNIDTSVFSTTFTGSLDLNISIRYRF